MESFIAVITSLSNIIGVPASLCLAWAAFIIRDQGKRLATLEADMKEMEDKFTEEDKQTVQEKLDELKKEIADKNIENVKQKREELEKAWMPIIQKAYQAQSEHANTADSGPQPSGDETIEDADFEEAK